MAFNLKRVLKALLFSTSQPLSIKDIQAAFARFHETAGLPEVEMDSEAPAPVEAGADPSAPQVADGAAVAPEPAPAPVETADLPITPVPVPEDADAEIYSDVPSLITAAQIRDAMTELAEEIRTSNDVYLLIEGANGYRLVTHPKFARWIRIQRNEPPPVKLTQSALETLAIVAYRQPVTRTEIETIRGVSAEAGINKLLERELIYITGRADLPGRPLQYGTTDKFLEFVGVKSIVELPASDVLSPRQIDEWLKNAIATKPPTDAEMGLPLEEGEGSTPNLENVSVSSDESPAAAAAEPSGDPVPPKAEPPADLPPTAS